MNDLLMFEVNNWTYVAMTCTDEVPEVGEVKRKKPPLVTQPKGTVPYVVSDAR